MPKADQQHGCRHGHLDKLGLLVVVVLTALPAALQHLGLRRQVLDCSCCLICLKGF
jgi:hypothetical protein